MQDKDIYRIASEVNKQQRRVNSNLNKIIWLLLIPYMFGAVWLCWNLFLAGLRSY